MKKLNFNSNTKKEIYDAYLQALENLKAKAESKHDPAAEVEAKKSAETLGKAEEKVNMSVEEQILNLQKNVSTVLNNLSNSFKDEIESYNNVQEAIKLKEAELQELFDIEKEAFSITALVNTKKELQAKYEADFEETKVTSLAKLDEINNQIAQARLDFNAQITKEKAEIQLQREREKEEYEYNFARRKQKDLDELNDSLASLRKQFNEEVEETQDELNAREKEVESREDNVSAREEHMDALETKVAAFPEKEAQIRAEALEQGRKEEAKTSAIKENAIKREFESKMTILENKNDMLQEALNSEKAKNQELSGKLDSAYDKLREMAMASVDSSKTVQAFESMSKSFSDKNQK